MGGSSKSQTVGYRYALGAHLALCHGPVDAIREIRVDDKTAWSIGSGASGAAQGAGVGAQVQLGTVAAMSAAAAVAPATLAQVALPGTLAGVRLGQSYDLRLAGDGTTRRVTLRGVSYSAGLGRTTWTVEPATMAFPAQTVTVAEAAGSAPSLSGATGGRIRIDKPDLFGGESREGGIVGDIDVLMGGPDQGPNDYLAARAGGPVPAFRGIASLVLRQVALGLNPYLKPWAVRLTRVLAAEAGALQWYPAKAAIVPVARISDAAIFIALDASGSMSGSRMAAQIAAVSRLLAEIGDTAIAPNDLEIVTWSDAVIASITRRSADATAYAELVAWVEALPTTTAGGTNFGAGVSRAAAFFTEAGAKRRIVVFVTDGVADLTQVNGGRPTKAIMAPEGERNGGFERTDRRRLRRDRRPAGDRGRQSLPRARLSQRRADAAEQRRRHGGSGGRGGRGAAPSRHRPRPRRKGRRDRQDRALRRPRRSSRATAGHVS